MFWTENGCSASGAIDVATLEDLKPKQIVRSDLAITSLAHDVENIYWIEASDQSSIVHRSSKNDWSDVVVDTITHRPENLFVDQQALYWSDVFSDINRVAKEGGSRTIIGSGFLPTGAVTNAPYIYWSLNDTIYRYEKQSGLTEAIFSSGQLDSFQVLLTTGAHVFLWLTRFGPTVGAVRSTLFDIGADPVELTSHEGVVAASVVDDSYIYWVAQGHVFRRPLESGPDEAFASAPASPNSLVLADGLLYWANAQENAIFRVEIP